MESLLVTALFRMRLSYADLPIIGWKYPATYHSHSSCVRSFGEVSVNGILSSQQQRCAGNARG
jgi:hypothetical protein